MIQSGRLSTFLRRIPQSNQAPLTLAELAADPHEIAIMHGYAEMLALLGIVSYEAVNNIADSQIRARSQSARYTLMSLASYSDNGLPMVEDWHSRGVEAQSDQILNRGVNFLYALEQRRIATLQQANASRQEKVAQVLIVRRAPDSSETQVLFQFDPNASQYQLIGGRWRPDDGSDMLQTMAREITEELNASTLSYPQDYGLDLLMDDITLPLSLSPTFGALTEYHFWIYHMRHLKKALRLQPEDQWVPVDQILSGGVIDSTGRHFPFAQGDLYQKMNAILPGGLAHLASSTDSETL